ncbi:MAG TPA: mechanosensitive ion channel family protein [Oligoflexia bacterium]|nr:mechanosensitive ion channel family protein [Oligoflexia bacterium]
MVFPQKKPIHDVSNLTLNDENIQIDPKPKDVLIQQNLNNIFKTMGWYDNVELNVKNGIVFLNGTVVEESHKRLASELISKMPDVIANVNNINVASPQNIDLKPAIQEVSFLKTKFSRMIPYFVSALIIFILFFSLAFAMHTLLKKALNRKLDSPLFVNAVAKILSAPFILLGLYFMIKVSGLNALATTILGGTGALGLILGLSLKSTLENYISSLMISLKKLFSKGDIVQIGEHKGIVHSVTTSGTTLIDYDGNQIIIPNSKVFSEVIKNFSSNPKMRDVIKLGIGFDDSIGLVKELIFSELSQFGERVLKDPEPSIIVNELGSATVNLLVYYWIDMRYTSAVKIKSAITQNIKERLMRENISMPDDAREVIFANALDIKMLNSDSSAIQDIHKSSDSDKKTQSKTRAQDLQSNKADLETEKYDLQEQASKSDIHREEDNLLQ